MGIRFSSRSQSPPRDNRDSFLRVNRRQSRTPSPRRLTVTEQLLQLQQQQQQPQYQQPPQPRISDPQEPPQPQQQPMFKRQPSNRQLRPQAPVYTGVQRPRTTSFPPTVQPQPTIVPQPWQNAPVTAVPTGGGAPPQPQPAPQAQNPTATAYVNLRPLDRTDDNDPRLPPRPYPNSYWATPQLLGSEYPSKGPAEMSYPRLDTLVRLGVVDFIDLTEPGELLPGEPYALNILPNIARKRGMGMIRMARMHEAHGRHRRSFSATMTGQQQQHPHPHLAVPERGRGSGHNRYPSDPAHHRTGITGEEGADWAVPVTRNTIRVAQYPIKDTTLPDPATLSTILTALAHSQAQGRRAVVHCNGGYGRTGTVIGCWYVHAGIAQPARVLYPNQYMQYRLPDGKIQLVPYVVKRNAGERALEMLAKKWKGVEKSRTAPFTPGNQLQMDFVKAFKPPPPPPPQQQQVQPKPQPAVRQKTPGVVGHPPVVMPAPPLQRSRTGR
ncbi:hypothetical protein FRB90_002583 [Tulasnella sp. 427]|nr:hypothetical protein FRB90_002583 [Tulasnella sp. 427]